MGGWGGGTYTRPLYSSTTSPTGLFSNYCTPLDIWGWVGTKGKERKGKTKEWSTGSLAKVGSFGRTTYICVGIINCDQWIQPATEQAIYILFIVLWVWAESVRTYLEYSFALLLLLWRIPYSILL